MDQSRNRLFLHAEKQNAPGLGAGALIVMERAFATHTSSN